MNLRKEIKFFLIRYALTFPAYYLLRLYAKTVRLGFEGDAAVRNHLERGERIVLASWHQRFFGGLLSRRRLGRPICIMISKSRDGDFIADVVERIGWVPVRGSSSRGGRQTLKVLVDEIARTRIAGHIVDGPKGPPRVVKPGLILPAQKAGAAICPTYVLYENPWVFNSWDRFMIPNPSAGPPSVSVPSNRPPKR